MCGICGIINFDKRPVARKSLKLMNDTMINRGPDDEGYFLKGHFGFAMRRLSIIDLESGKQPMKSSNGRFHIVFNGELYNYIELRQELIKKNYHFSTNSDTEVVINYFQEKGIEGLNDLNGMFAIAIWDNVNEQLILIRDRVGIKPIYYASINGSFTFCSTLDGINTINNKNINISYSSLLQFLSFSYIPYPNSIFENVYKVKPGHYLIVDGSGKIEEKEYWSKNLLKYNYSNTRNYKENIYHLLQDSVRIQKRSDVPIGTFLSGGLDSSAVVAFLSQNVDGPINTFSIGFEDGLNELPLAKKVSGKFNTNHHEVYVKPNEMLNILPEIVENLDEPLSDNSLFPTYYLSKIAVENGIKVILNGTGGDELFGGYHRHLPPDLKRKILYKIPINIRNLIGRIVDNQTSDKIETILNPGFDFYRGISGISLEFLGSILYEKSDIQKVKEFVDSNYYSINSSKNGAHTPHSLMLLDFNDYLVNDVLSVLDKMTMAVSLEGRVPLLDHRLVELCFNIPQNELLLNNERKGLFKDVLQEILPHELFQQPKAGFAMPINSWVNNSFKPIIKENLLFNRHNLLDNYFDPRALSNILGKDVIPTRFTNMVFSLFILNEWLLNKFD